MIISMDTGFAGAIAFFNPDNSFNSVFKMPIIKVKSGYELNVKVIYSLLNANKIRHCYVEQVHSMPGNGAKSAFKFGGQYYSLLTILQLLEIPYSLITPHQWKKKMLPGLDSKDKNSSILRVKQMIPSIHQNIKDGEAEAILIGKYGILNIGV